MECEKIRLAKTSFYGRRLSESSVLIHDQVTSSPMRMSCVVLQEGSGTQTKSVDEQTLSSRSVNLVTI